MRNLIIIMVVAVCCALISIAAIEQRAETISTDNMNAVEKNCNLCLTGYGISTERDSENRFYSPIAIGGDYVTDDRLLQQDPEVIEECYANCTIQVKDIWG